MAPPTAAPAAIVGSGMKRATVTPTMVERILPPTSGQGCASGLAGTAKASTADAPIGATMMGRSAVESGSCLHTTMVSEMPISAPIAATRRGEKTAS